MRKSLLLFLVALVMPAIAFAAENKAVNVTANGTYNNKAGGSNEDMIYVAPTALGWEQAPTPAEGANFSIGMWFKTTEIYNDGHNHPSGVLMRLGSGNNNNYNGAIQLLQDRSTKALKVSTGGDNTGGASALSNANCGTAEFDQWNFILMVFDSTNQKFTAYLNGTKTCEVSASGVFGYTSGDGVFAFGGFQWRGYMDEIQMYNAALTADEAAKAYNNEATSISSLTALYDFNAVKSGTTGQFESVAGLQNANPATFENSVFNYWWADGELVERASHSEKTPTLVAGREIDGEIVDPNPNPEPEPDPTYCTPSGQGCDPSNWQIGNNFHNTRFVRTITASDGVSEVTIEGTTTATNVPQHRQKFYYDRTANVLNTTPGATIQLTVDGMSHWLCQYVFIDFDKDGTYDYDKTIATANADLVAHTGYDPSGAAPTTNSIGETTSADGEYGNATFPIPAFTLPANMAPGRYRIRFVMAWNNPDPCFTTTNENHKGTMFDFYINVEGSLEPRTVAVATENAEYGSVAIQGSDELSIETADAVTVVATPAEGYAFMNWTNEAGQVVSTNATYSYKGTEDATLTAHFGFLVTIEASEGGSATLFNEEGDLVKNGTVVVPGTQLVVAVSETAPYRLVSLTVNGEAVEKGATIEVNSAITVKAVFSDAPYVVKINVNGEGNVVVCNDITNDLLPSESADFWTNNSPIAEGDTPYIIVTAKEGYELTNLTIKGDDDEEFSYEKEDVIEDYRAIELENGITFICAGVTGDLEINAVFAAKTAAIEGIDADNANAPVEYFNLQGMRVNADNLTPGVYVTRQGSKTAKVLVK